MKFQITQAIASLIVNKWFQLLPLLGCSLYRLVSTPSQPRYLRFLLEKPLSLTPLGRALASMATSPLILCPSKPHPIT